MSDMRGPTVVLRAKKEKPVLNRHPWVFSGAIERVAGSPAAGDIVTVTDRSGQALAKGYINPKSQIVVRLLTWELDEPIDKAFWRRRLAEAVAGRELLGLDSEATTAYRLVNAESDGLPGLIVDRYGDYLVVQFLTLGVDCRRDDILDALEELVLPAGIYERDDVGVRAKEGLREQVGLLRGAAPPDQFEVRECGRRFLVDMKTGQKTGFYLDQRENRERVARFAGGRHVLNCFSYTGGFSIYAAAAGALSITNVDVSAEALALGDANMRLNGLQTPVENRAANVFEDLRKFRDEGRQFDLIILDPPKFATSKAQVQSATRGYKDINLLGMHLLRQNGLLATFSCSGLMDRDLFQKVLFGASVDAGRPVQIIETLSQAADHPVLLSFPESAYLKGAICRAL